MKINPIIKQLLEKRGITSDEDIQEFLSEKPQKTYNPFLLSDMEAGVDLILSEAKKGSRICIYGDYDADGITSTTLMMSVLAHVADPNKLQYYIPSRFEEGYGLNMEAIKHIADDGCNMIITVDCGSVSYQEVEYAKSLGMKIVVTDHHNITDVMADCILINPKKPGSQYPFKELSGCGVAFKVAQALQQKAGLPKRILTEVLDLAAIGTVGDIMPLVDENRTITKFGIKVMNTGSRPGLKKLIEGASLKIGNITSGNISFVIVPHLNASGRIEDASQAVELLLGRCSEERMNFIVKDILEKNIQRKTLQGELFEMCSAEIDKDNPDDIVILQADRAHEGIAGIVAGKIKDAYYRPAIILTPIGEMGEGLKGTGRSIEGVDLYKLLKTQEHLFEKFGGHSGACGFSIKSENFEALLLGLRKEMKELKSQNEDLFKRKYNIDLTLQISDMTVDLAEQLELLAPFGNKNPKPLIMCENVMVEGVRYMGSDLKHARFFAEDDEGNRIQCIVFNKAQDYDLESPKWMGADIMGTLDCQVWQGVKRLQFITSDMKENDDVKDMFLDYE